ncbi:MAG: MBL fold metallo-hydrolase, partial [Anaerolineales bacterium]
MIFKQYFSEGIAHFSYLIADGDQAVVIDPRRDVDCYLEDAAAGGFHINYVLETHRNEDYVIGSPELEAATGVTIYHADRQWDYEYGLPVEDGQDWRVGRLLIRAIATPGHTPGSMSYLLHDPDGKPWTLFSGDALFSGDVGRVDLLGEARLEEMADVLYDSLFEKILPLGDEILLCPAHGAGSVCGSGIADRNWTTIGFERLHNPKLQVESKAKFIDLHAKMLNRPPYFRMMERLNLTGAPILRRYLQLRPLMPDAFEIAAQSAQVVDVRGPISFGKAHVPGSLSILADALASFAGWFLNYEEPILFVCDPQSIPEIIRIMIRLGFDALFGYLNGGMVAWAKAGKPLASLDNLTVEEFCDVLQSAEPKLILDVRAEDEIKGKGLKTAKKIELVKLMD